MRSYLLIIFLFLVYLNNAFTQVNAGPDKEICEGESTQLEGSSSGSYTYEWTSSPPDPTISNPNILTPTVTPSTTTLYTLNGREVSTVNLVTNGDFEQGFTGFTSDYDYCDQPNCLAVTPSPANGIFGVHENPNYLHNNFSACNDHSATGTQMMVCNGDEFNNLILYETTVSGISTNTEYEFSVFLTNVITVVPPIIPQFEFKINDQTIGTLSLSGGACSWTEFSAAWNSGSSSSATIKIINTTTYPSDWGNDFAIDDVSLYEVIMHSDQCTVTINDIPTSTFNVQESACMEETVSVTYTGNSTSDATYNWDFGQDATIISGSNQGPYEVRWTSSGVKTISLWVENGCISDTTYNTITIFNNPEIVITADATTIAYGTNTTLHGTVISSPSFDFSWSPEAMLVNPNSLDPQTVNLNLSQWYYLTVADNGCNATDSIYIEVDGGPLTILSLVADPDTICIGVPVILSIIAQGGSGSYTYTWESNPPGYSHSGPEDMVTVLPVENTSYTVTVEDGFNPGVSTNVQVIVLELTEIIEEPQDLVVNPGSSATFTIEAVNSEHYQWQLSIDDGNTWTDLVDGSLYSGALTNILLVDPVDLSMNGYLFQCLASGQCGNPISETSELTVSESPAFISNLSNATICEGETFAIEFNSQNFTNITEFIFYLEFDWSIIDFENIANVVAPLEGKIIVEETTDGISVRMNSNEPVTTADGILFELSFYALMEGYTDISWDNNLSEIVNSSEQKLDLILANGYAQVNPDAEVPTEIIANRDTINIQEEISITLEAIGGSGDNLIWTRDACNGDSVGSGPEIEIPRPESTTTYFAHWRNQCGNSECVSKDIIIVYEYNIGIPNAFTPNNDGRNDEFKIVSAAPLKDFKMQIFSRSNVLVFESDDQNNGWNGVYKNTPMRSETYIYIISYKVPNMYSGFDNIVRRGVVTLIR